MKKFRKIISTALVAALVLSIAMTAGCSKKEETKPETSNTEDTKKEDTTKEESNSGTNADGSKNNTKLVLTVNDEKLFLDEMMYYIMMQEFQLMQTEQRYISYFGTSYLDSEYSEGVTVRDMAKTSTMEAVTTYEVLYQQAVKEGYKLTKEDEKKCEESVGQIMPGITKEQLEITGLTEEMVSKVMKKMTVALKYMEDTIDAFDIDDEGIKKGISKEENRQYNTEYLFVSTAKADEEGKAITPTEDEKKAAKEKLEAIAAKAKTEEFSKIVEGNQEITTQPSNFIKGKSAQGEEYEKAAMSLDNKEVSNIIETEGGYYIIKMLDNNSTEAYDTACKEAIANEEQKRFSEKYEELKKDYKIEINEEVWEPIVMGNTTIVQTAPEESDSEEKAEPEKEAPEPEKEAPQEDKK